jgi:hypothetical protein
MKHFLKHLSMAFVMLVCAQALYADAYKSGSNGLIKKYDKNSDRDRRSDRERREEREERRARERRRDRRRDSKPRVQFGIGVGAPYGGYPYYGGYGYPYGGYPYYGGPGFYFGIGN